LLAPAWRPRRRQPRLACAAADAPGSAAALGDGMRSDVARWHIRYAANRRAAKSQMPSMPTRWLPACSSSGPGAALGPAFYGPAFRGSAPVGQKISARSPADCEAPELPPALGIEVHSVRPRRKHGTISSVSDNGQRSGSAQRTPSRPMSSAMTTGQTRSRPGSTGRRSVTAADDADGVDANAGFGVWDAWTQRLGRPLPFPVTIMLVNGSLVAVGAWGRR